MRRASAGRMITRVEMVSLLEDEAAACRAGGGGDPIRELLDWIIGTPPKPDQWPPQML